MRQQAYNEVEADLRKKIGLVRQGGLSTVARVGYRLPLAARHDKPSIQPVAGQPLHGVPGWRLSVTRKAAIKDGAERPAWNQMARGRTGRVRRERESGLIARCRYVSAVSPMGLRVRAESGQVVASVWGTSVPL